MKFYCNGLDLIDGVLKVIRAASVKTVNPVLEGIYLKAEEDSLRLCATDQELWIETKIPADVKIEGETVVPGKLFSDFIRKLSGEQIEINVDNQLMKIIYSDSESFFQCFDSSEFPEPKKIEKSEYFEITKKDLKDLINKTIFSVSIDDARPILKGCLFEIIDGNITAVALDGFRLALAKKPIESTANFSVICPAKSLSEISKFLDDNDDKVKIFVQKNYILIDIDNSRIVSRRLEGDFINYNQVISQTPANTRVVVSKMHLEDAIERASLLAKHDKNNVVKFETKGNVLVISSASNVGNVKENITMSIDGKDVNISFNAKYVSDCLKNINEEFIKINFTNQISPFTITSVEKEDYLYLILPVRNL